ncbi:MAG: GNAT family N-acetyltransferase [Blautia sp.]|nr:GNAT family N-acetyltransferase [Blautia sp.]
MKIRIREFQPEDAEETIAIWNQVVEEGMAFPQTEELGTEDGIAFFEGQSYTGVACDEETGEIVGLYILHPNNIGRCGHIANASYAVKGNLRGLRIGEKLVTACLAKAGQLGFRLLQFNAVVRSNFVAQKLYDRLGFVKIGMVPGGFLNKKEEYEDIILYYHTL